LQRDGRAASTRNKYVQAITALCRWATKKGYLARNPIAESETIHREQHARRHRRLTPDRMNEHGKLEQAGEERALLAVSGPHLQRLTIGALETGCRLSELLRLTWRDIDLTRKELTIRAETAKTRRVRILPVSSRLAGVLEMAQTALSTFLCSGNGRLNEQERADRVAACFVFGDQAGRRVKCIRKAWDTAVLKAHGHKPAWIGANTLSADSRAALRAIDLHFHDLRHEAGSRLLEAGWPLHHVQEMLGHANVSQTSTYLNATRVGLQESMSRFQESRCNLVAIEGAVERAPLRNGEPVKATQHQVN
jgi:integrase